MSSVVLFTAFASRQTVQEATPLVVKTIPTGYRDWRLISLDRAGQTMTHAMFGDGEVMAVIEPQKIDVLFPDRVRRLIHSQS